MIALLRLIFVSRRLSDDEIAVSVRKWLELPSMRREPQYPNGRGYKNVV